MNREIMEIRCYDLEGNFLQNFDSPNAAEKSLKIDASKIRLALTSTTKCFNYQFRHGNCKTNHIGSVVVKKDRKKPVSKYWGDNLISVYDSINDASRKNDMQAASVSNSCNKRVKAFGFNFKFI